MTLLDASKRRDARRCCAAALSLVAISGFGATTTHPAEAQNAAAAQKSSVNATGSPGYTRAVRDADGQITAVQTAIRRFTPPSNKSDQPTVYLVAVTHIGEKSYYAQIQRLLDKQDLVLFEGVRPSKDEGKKTLAEQRADSEKAHTTQKRLSDALGVQFQLDGIDYRHATFHDSDLSWDELVAAAKHSGAGSEAQLDTLRATMNGGGPEAGATGAMLDTILTMVEKQPAIAQMFRTVLLKALSDTDALAKMQAQVAGTTPGAKIVPGSDLMETVLIEARNQVVLHDLKTDIVRLKPGASVALFYGAGHMKDMEHRLETEMGYRPADTQWLTALNAKTATPSSIPSAANASTSE